MSAQPKARINNVSTWYGKPIDELTREELIEALEWCGTEIVRLRTDRDRWKESGDALKYLAAKGKL